MLLEIIRNDNSELLTIVTHTDGVTPYDLTGVQEVTFSARRLLGGPLVFQKKLSVGGVVLTAPLLGEMRTYTVPSDTAGLPNIVCELVYDIEIVDQLGAARTVEEAGRLVVIPDVA